jgi:hypothetical protein
VAGVVEVVVVVAYLIDVAISKSQPPQNHHQEVPKIFKPKRTKKDMAVCIVKVMQSRYRPGVAQRIPGSKVSRLPGCYPKI